MTARKITVHFAIIGITYAFMGYGGPGPSQTDHMDLGLFKFSLQPTPATDLNIHARNELQTQKWTDTYAIINGSPLTCATL